MFNIFGAVVDTGVLLLIVWASFSYLTSQRISYLKKYREVSVLFFLCSAVLFALYFSWVKPFFVTFSFQPFLVLLAFYIVLIITYHLMKPHLNMEVVRKNEKKRVYFTSMKYNYIISKSFNILFQQISVLCVVAFLKALGIPNLFIMLFFALLFGFAHFYLHLKEKAAMIANIFIPASVLGGFIFSFILLDIQYGIIYTYIIHWSFYLVLGVLLNMNRQKV